MSGSLRSQYDFIVVGGGPSGCAVAWRLANNAKKPSVLLIEAGGSNDEVSNRIDGDRWITRMNPKYNWQYETTPQAHLDNKIVAYDRGKGLGGSSGINFCAYTVGPSGDWDELAKVADDTSFSWSNASEALRRIEAYRTAVTDLPEYAEKYLKPDMKNHGQSGPLVIGFPKKWETNVRQMADTCHEVGIPLNNDMNSGDPIGLGILPNTAYGGLRTTAGDLVQDGPSNLSILLNTEVRRLVFDGTKCTGVETKSQHISASREIILSCGSLDSPRILMHSGIGPRSQLEKFGINTLVDLPGVGATLRDHHHIAVSWEREAHTTQRHAYYQDPEAQKAAREQWNKDRTGPLADFGTAMAIAWLKSSEITQSDEFLSLPQEVRSHVEHSTVPTHEIMFNPCDLEYLIDPFSAPPLFTSMVFVMNPQSLGTVTLQSSDPTVPLLFDPNFFSHPYDKRVAIEATRNLFQISQQPSFQKDTIKLHSGPSSLEEEDILSFWRRANMSTWHMSSTIPLGPGPKTTSQDQHQHQNQNQNQDKNKTQADNRTRGQCLTNEFKVLGTTGLRVIDMSVIPFVMNCHTQAPAYCLGVIGGDKIVQEHGLDLN